LSQSKSIIFEKMGELLEVVGLTRRGKLKSGGRRVSRRAWREVSKKKKKKKKKHKKKREEKKKEKKKKKKKKHTQWEKWT